jgi:hypothetical protein
MSSTLSAPPPAADAQSPRPIKRSHLKMTTADANRHLSACSLWQSTNRFFAAAPTLERFEQLLRTVEPPSKNIPLGRHYSITINQALRQRYKGATVLLKAPTEAAPADGAQISPTSLFHRLLA